MGDQPLSRLSRDEIEAEWGTPLPAKEVFSPLLDLNVDLDLALDLAAPIDLAVAANANVAAPIDAAVAANVLSFASTSAALADRDVLIDQHISGDAIAYAPQQAALDQSNDVVDDGSGTVGGGTGDGATIDETLSDPLLNVDVNVALDADLAAPVACAVAANANVAAPIDAAVAANVGSIGSSATAVADQDAIITQDLDEVVAQATADQDVEIEQ
jgi:hypothetical protein